MPKQRQFPDESFLMQGVGSAAYLRCRDVLLRYLSRTSVDIILPRACTERCLDPLEVQGEQLHEIVQQLSPGMRLFCRPEQLTELMLELAELLLEFE